LAASELIRIVLTGGPGGGKSTARPKIVEWLDELGYVVVSSQEGATSLITGNVRPGSPWLGSYSFNQSLLEYILAEEDLLARMALSMETKDGKPRILLCDRGVLDIIAYAGRDAFEDMAIARDTSPLELMDRYELVVHLVTAAKGAEEFYTLANNAARTETRAEARALDDLTMDAWRGSRHLRVVDNSTDFEGKLLRVRQEIARVLGIPEPLEIERKFLLSPERMRDAALPSDFSVGILQDYLTAPGGVERRVRQRIRHGKGGAQRTFFYTEKRQLRAGVRREEETQITEHEYVQLLDDRDAHLQRIEKERLCFIHEHQYFELDRFRGRHEGLYLLEVELTTEQQQVVLPPFAEGAVDVTDDPQYSNRRLAADRAAAHA
jgi:CYTH domain-containing protein/predicted ATPase